MTNERLTLTGWLSIVNAVLSIPVIGLYAFAGLQPSAAVKLIAAPLTLIPLALWVYVLVSFKSLLNSHFHFHDTDFSILVLIWIYGVSALLSIIELLSVALETADLETAGRIADLLLMIPFGIMSIVFAITLLRLPNTLHGLLKPYAYTVIAMGFCTGIIVLISVGLLVRSVVDILLGMIFSERQTVQEKWQTRETSSAEHRPGGRRARSCQCAMRVGVGVGVASGRTARRLLDTPQPFRA